MRRDQVYVYTQAMKTEIMIKQAPYRMCTVHILLLMLRAKWNIDIFATDVRKSAVVFLSSLLPLRESICVCVCVLSMHVENYFRAPTDIARWP